MLLCKQAKNQKKNILCLVLYMQCYNNFRSIFEQQLIILIIFYYFVK
jgi:hypothetical protein